MNIENFLNRTPKPSFSAEDERKWKEARQQREAQRAREKAEQEKARFERLLRPRATKQNQATTRQDEQHLVVEVTTTHRSKLYPGDPGYEEAVREAHAKNPSQESWYLR